MRPIPAFLSLALALVSAPATAQTSLPTPALPCSPLDSPRLRSILWMTAVQPIVLKYQLKVMDFTTMASLDAQMNAYVAQLQDNWPVIGVKVTFEQFDGGTGIGSVPAGPAMHTSTMTWPGTHAGAVTYLSGTSSSNLLNRWYRIRAITSLTGGPGVPVLSRPCATAVADFRLDLP